MRGPSLSNLNLLLESSHGWCIPGQERHQDPVSFCLFTLLQHSIRSLLQPLWWSWGSHPTWTLVTPLEGELAPDQQFTSFCFSTRGRGHPVQILTVGEMPRGLGLGLDYQNPSVWECWGSRVSLWWGVLLSKGGKTWLLVETVTCPRQAPDHLMKAMPHPSTCQFCVRFLGDSLMPWRLLFFISEKWHRFQSRDTTFS